MTPICRVYDTACLNPTYCDARDACCAGDPECDPTIYDCDDCEEDVDGYLWSDEEGNLWASPLKDDHLRGRCSGIPECCIAYFVSRTNQLLVLDPRAEGWGYVPCPACVDSGNRVEAKSCRDDSCICGQWSERTPL